MCLTLVDLSLSHFRQKRRLDQFSVVIANYVKERHATEFNGYGNWCGPGGSGPTVDTIDEYV